TRWAMARAIRIGCLPAAKSACETPPGTAFGLFPWPPIAPRRRYEWARGLRSGRRPDRPPTAGRDPTVQRKAVANRDRSPRGNRRRTSLRAWWETRPGSGWRLARHPAAQIAAARRLPRLYRDAAGFAKTHTRVPDRRQTAARASCDRRSQSPPGRTGCPANWRPTAALALAASARADPVRKA